MLLGLAAVAAASSPAQVPRVTCHGATSTTIAVSWDPVDATDAYYVTLSKTASSRPFALQTTTTPSLTIVDLLPSTAYMISVRSHPSENNIVWGWRPSTPPLQCSTTSAPNDRPHRLFVIGDSPQPHSLQLGWSASVASNSNVSEASQTYQVGVRQLGQGNSEWQWSEAPTALQHTVTGLPPSSTFEVAVRDGTSGRVSEPLMMRTCAVGALHVRAYRASEYSFDVDFLQNHDAASFAAMPVYLQNGGAINETALERSGGGAPWSMDGCLSALDALCGEERGESFTCMACADRHRADVTHACGNFSDGDDHHGWGVHYFCGIGWPGSSFQRSPVTEYCVEHAPAPQSAPRRLNPLASGFFERPPCFLDLPSLHSKGDRPRIDATSG